MHPTRRALAVDGLIALLTVAAEAELWVGHRAAAGTATALLAGGAAAALLAHRAAPPFAVAGSCAAEAVLLESMPRPMVTSAVTLAAAALLAGTLSSRRTRSAWLGAALGGLAAAAVAADYARGRAAITWAAVGAGVVICWGAGVLAARRAADEPPAGEPAAKAAIPAQRKAPADKPSPEPVTPMSARRWQVVRQLADTVTAGLNSVIVESVAAQQALVREAHPDDVIVRMQAAEEHAHTAAADLRRLLTVAELVRPEAADPHGSDGDPTVAADGAAPLPA